MTLGSKGVKRYTNIDYAFVSGFEIDVEIRATKWMNVSTSFTYTYGRDNNLIPLPLMPPLKNNTQVFFSINRNNISLSLNTASDQNRYRESEGETSSPAYAVLSAQYSRRIGGEKHGLFMVTGVDNILDTYYYDHLDWNAIPRTGRDFFLKLQYQFN